MLFLAQALLKAAGLKYDDIDDTWVVPVRLRPVVTVECDEGGAYIMESLLEVHAVLEAIGCTYNNFALRGGYLSLVGLTTAQVAAAVA
jgi:hypothetical protein